MHKFEHLFSETTHSLKERGISITENLQHQLPILKDSEINDAMDVVNNYCSFFNYRIVEHIINKLGTEQDKENLSEYKRAFDEYASDRHIFRCPSEVGTLTKNDVTMFVTLDESHSNSTICDLDLFVINLQGILKMPPYTGLKLCQIAPGSLKLTFQLPPFVVLDTFPLSDEQETELSNIGVSNLWFIYQFNRHQKQVILKLSFLCTCLYINNVGCIIIISKVLSQIT